jgi:ELWxxDGT repeat protein
MNKNAGLYELWKTDGTKNGTLKISEFKVPENSTSKLYAFNDSLYFAAFDNKNILKIWKSDGTNNGTNPVENWNEFTLTSISDMVLFNDGIYFSATQPNNRTALFKYLNGTHYLSKVEILVSLNKLIISPNPALNYLNVNLPDKKQNGIITIYDIRGSKILSIVVQPGQQFISADVSNLKNGLYIVSFSGNSGTSVTKFVKK